jgi:hypothetical protein
MGGTGPFDVGDKVGGGVLVCCPRAHTPWGCQRPLTTAHRLCCCCRVCVCVCAPPSGYLINRQVLVPHTDKFYEAKVQKAQRRDDGLWYYFLHYSGGAC